MSQSISSFARLTKKKGDMGGFGMEGRHVIILDRGLQQPPLLSRISGEIGPLVRATVADPKGSHESTRGVVQMGTSA